MLSTTELSTTEDTADTEGRLYSDFENDVARRRGRLGSERSSQTEERRQRRRTEGTRFSQAGEVGERIDAFDGPACVAGRLTPTGRIGIMNGTGRSSRSRSRSEPSVCVASRRPSNSAPFRLRSLRCSVAPFVNSVALLSMIHLRRLTTSTAFSKTTNGEGP